MLIPLLPTRLTHKMSLRHEIRPAANAELPDKRKGASCAACSLTELLKYAAAQFSRFVDHQSTASVTA